MSYRSVAFDFPARYVGSFFASSNLFGVVTDSSASVIISSNSCDLDRRHLDVKKVHFFHIVPLRWVSKAISF